MTRCEREARAKAHIEKEIFGSPDPDECRALNWYGQIKEEAKYNSVGFLSWPKEIESKKIEFKDLPLWKQIEARRLGWNNTAGGEISVGALGRTG